MKPRNILFVAVLIASLLFVGCSGVIMNAEYSTLLDRTCAIANEVDKRAQTGELNEEQMKYLLHQHNLAWHAFKDARDGRNPNERQ